MLLTAGVISTRSCHHQCHARAWRLTTGRLDKTSDRVPEEYEWFTRHGYIPELDARARKSVKGAGQALVT